MMIEVLLQWKCQYFLDYVWISRFDSATGGESYLDNYAVVKVGANVLKTFAWFDKMVDTCIITKGLSINYHFWLHLHQITSLKWKKVKSCDKNILSKPFFKMSYFFRVFNDLMIMQSSSMYLPIFDDIMYEQPLTAGILIMFVTLSYINC